MQKYGRYVFEPFGSPDGEAGCGDSSAAALGHCKDTSEGDRALEELDPREVSGERKLIEAEA